MMYDVYYSRGAEIGKPIGLPLIGIQVGAQFESV
jgi:hypothetical protein